MIKNMDLPLNKVFADMNSLTMLRTVAVCRVDGGGRGVRGDVVRVVIVVTHVTEVVVMQGVCTVAMVTDCRCHASSWTFFFQ